MASVLPDFAENQTGCPVPQRKRLGPEPRYATALRASKHALAQVICQWRIQELIHVTTSYTLLLESDDLSSPLAVRGNRLP